MPISKWIPFYEVLTCDSYDTYAGKRLIGYKCSYCKKGFETYPRNYCPNCGAKMVKDEE